MQAFLVGDLDIMNFRITQVCYSALAAAALSLLPGFECLAAGFDELDSNGSYAGDGVDAAMAPDSDGFYPATEAGYAGLDANGSSCRGSAGCPGCPDCRENCPAPPHGLINNLIDNKQACWTGRVDALILSRNAPGNRPLYTFNPASAGTALNADQLESIAAVGPRLSLFRTDHCGTASWESTYIYSGGFVSERSLPPSVAGYLTAPPGIYGNDSPPVNSLNAASARLTSSLQSAELNRRWCWGSCTQFLAGFRWLQWQENLAISNAYAAGSPNFGQDVYTTGCYNNLFGGQIGLDTALWQPSKHFRLEGLVKAGAYYNSANQSSSYQNYVGGAPFQGNSVSAGSSPAVCSFAGELGLTGVVPICCNLDLRVGYFGLWLTSLAQPANQLSNQLVMPPPVPTYSSLSTNGNVVLQGLSLGLEGRW